MKKFKLGKDLLTLTIITLLAVITWIAVEIWLIATETTITKVTREQMLPINPQINAQIIESLKSNFTLSDEEIEELISNPPATAVSDETEEQEEDLVEIEEPITELDQAATESSQVSTESAILE